MRKGLIIIFLLFLSFPALSQDEIWMKPNLGQWHENVEYKIAVPGGNMFLEKGGFTYMFHNFGDHYDHAHGITEEEQPNIEAHVVKTKFIGANATPLFEESGESPFYENYIIGNDPGKWVSELRAYEEVEYIDLYDGINLKLYKSNGTLKYDVIIKTGTDPALFQVKYEGQDNLSIHQGELLIETQLGTITESKPIAYQWIGPTKKKIACEYKLSGNVMTFIFPEGYDDSADIIIDPELAFSSFTASTADNWGMTAAPDANKKMVYAS